MLKKEEIIWKRNPPKDKNSKGEFTAEEVKVEIYDKNLDFELRTEALSLDSMRKQQEILKDSKENKDKELLVRLSVNVKQSLEIIKELKQKIEDTKKVEIVKIIPCTVNESINVQQGKTLDGQETDDVIAHLIHKKCKDPLLTFEEAQDMRSDYRIAIKDVIMEHSGFKVQSYRDEILERHRSEKKKDI